MISFICRIPPSAKGALPDGTHLLPEQDSMVLVPSSQHATRHRENPWREGSAHIVRKTDIEVRVSRISFEKST